MLLEVEHLSKRFGDLNALQDVSFKIHQGEILGLIGPNGAGKTTLLESLAGILPIDSGMIRCNEHPLTASERGATLFYVPDGIAPWSAQPVGWTLDYIVGLFGGRAENRDEIVDQLDLRQLLQRPIGKLSRGQRKRALLAVGLLTPHPLLLIDEPFEGLDLRQARDIAAALQVHATRGRTLFLSIHQIGDAARFCHRFLLLSGGRVCGEGTVQELAAHAVQRDPTVSNDLEEVFLALT